MKYLRDVDKQEDIILVYPKDTLPDYRTWGKCVCHVRERSLDGSAAIVKWIFFMLLLLSAHTCMTQMHTTLSTGDKRRLSRLVLIGKPGNNATYSQ